MSVRFYSFLRLSHFVTIFMLFWVSMSILIYRFTHSIWSIIFLELLRFSQWWIHSQSLTNSSFILTFLILFIFIINNLLYLFIKYFQTFIIVEILPDIRFISLEKSLLWKVLDIDDVYTFKTCFQTLEAFTQWQNH